MAPLYIVGDIHGCANELYTLLQALPLKSEDTIVFLGDYVDRGPSSAAAIGLLLELRQDSPARTVFLKGNHEAMLLSYLGSGDLEASVFFRNGGGATLTSYGISPDARAVDAALMVPEVHMQFLRGLDLKYLAPPFLAVHAGIDPDRGLDDQDEADLLWIRERFTGRGHGLPYTVCFGHTPQGDVLVDLPCKIGLDTGCVYGNRLSCLEVSEGHLFQVRAGERRVIRRDLEIDPGVRRTG